jgi:protein-arginine kinase
MVLLAQLKFGCDLGIISVKGGGNALHKLMIETQPGNLQTCLKKTMGSVQRDEQRAKYLNEHLPELIITEEDGTED